MQQSGQRATKAQQQKLLELMEQNPEIATGTAKSKATSFWDDAALQLNAMGPPFKTGKDWLQTWIQKKYNTKRKLTENKKQQNMTGGRVAKLHAIDEGDERVLAVANLEKSVTAVPESICLGVPNVDQTEQQPGPSKRRIETTNLNQPPQKKRVTCTDTNVDGPILIDLESDSSLPQQPIGDDFPEQQGNRRPQPDFTKAVLEQNEKIIKNLESLNELARTFVYGTLNFQKELLEVLKKP